MMESRLQLERLKILATQLVEAGNTEEELKRLLQKITDVAGLRSLAEEFAPHPEVAFPVYRRLVELRPDDPDFAAGLGWVFWACGEDDKAGEQAARGARLDPDNVDTLLLRAALEPNRAEKRRLYKRVLNQDPTNSVALANLKEMEGSGTAKDARAPTRKHY